MYKTFTMLNQTKYGGFCSCGKSDLISIISAFQCFWWGLVFFNF